MDLHTKAPNPKCVCCRSYWEPNNDDLKSSGYHYKSCRRCRKSKKTAEEIRAKQNERARLYIEKKREIYLGNDLLEMTRIVIVLIPLQTYTPLQTYKPLHTLIGQ